MLYLIGSPIGNLGDISVRALEILQSVDLIAAEDTRRTSILLAHYQIHKPLTSYHDQNEQRKTSELVEKLQDGRTIALLTDAGMPSISDPGFRLVNACRQHRLPYSVVPGPSAILTGLVGSGFPCHEFYYGGFLPVKSGRRQRELMAAVSRGYTSIYFETPHRLVKSLAVLRDLSATITICVARELTKQFEEFRAGTAAELIAHFEMHPPRGEITLIISGAAQIGPREETFLPAN